MPKYHVAYRGEIETEVEADNADEAVYQAEQSERWRFILNEGHKDLFEVTDISNP